MDIQTILATFERFDGTYQREAVEAAIAQREAIIPELITILETIAAEPDRFVDDEDYYAHIYAVMLLGHFQVTTAHPVILEVFSLPDPAPDKLFGDIITGQLPRILTNTCDGALEGIQALAKNPKAYLFCRSAALQAVSYSVLEGWISREAALHWFESFLKSADPATVTEDDIEFYISVGYVLCDLCPAEVMDTVHWAFEQEVLIDDFMLAKEDFEDALARGPDGCLAELKTSYERSSLADLHQVMAGWACFQPPRPVSPPPMSVPASRYPRSAPKTPKKKKKFWDL
jgi:hypothetical protein